MDTGVFEIQPHSQVLFLIYRNEIMKKKQQINKQTNKQKANQT